MSMSISTLPAWCTKHSCSFRKSALICASCPNTSDPAGAELQFTASVHLGNGENLAWIDQVGIADLALVRLVDQAVVDTVAIGAPGDAPQAGAGLDHDALAGRQS